MKHLLSVLAEPSRWTSTQWHAVLGTIFRPEHLPFLAPKIFRLNAQAHYVDCFFPIPCEHYFGGEQIIGQSVRDVVPKVTWHTIRNGLKQASEHHQPILMFASLTLSPYASRKISVLFLPLHTTDVLMFVTDLNQDGSPRFPMEEWNPAVSELKQALWPAEHGPDHEQPEGLERSRDSSSRLRAGASHSRTDTAHESHHWRPQQWTGPHGP